VYYLFWEHSEYDKSKPRPEVERARKRRERNEEINRLLDEMNDYRRLYETFGDAEYAERILRVKEKLRKLTEVEE
jgi:nicotinamide riboside kinase